MPIPDNERIGDSTRAKRARTRPVNNSSHARAWYLLSSEPAKRGPLVRGVIDRSSTYLRSERGGGQVLFCRGSWPGPEGAALVRRSVFFADSTMTASTTMIFKNVPKDLHRDFKVWCARNDVTMSATFIAFMQDTISRTYDDDPAGALLSIFDELIAGHNWEKIINDDTYDPDKWTLDDWGDFWKVFKKRYGKTLPQLKIEGDIREFLKQRKSTERPARRKTSLRQDAHVGSAEKSIEQVFGLPRGSVNLVNPDGRKARTDKLIGALLRDWGQ